MCWGSLENESRDIESHQQELTMMSNLIPFVAAEEEAYRRDRAPRHFVRAAWRRESRRTRRDR
jgi:hypothetical protein